MNNAFLACHWAQKNFAANNPPVLLPEQSLLARLCAKILATVAAEPKLDPAAVSAVYARTVGALLAKHTRVLDIKRIGQGKFLRAKLIIECDHPAFNMEARRFRQPLDAAFRRENWNITEIIWR